MKFCLTRICRQVSLHFFSARTVMTTDFKTGNIVRLNISEEERLKDAELPEALTFLILGKTPTTSHSSLDTATTPPTDSYLCCLLLTPEEIFKNYEHRPHDGFKVLVEDFTFFGPEKMSIKDSTMFLDDVQTFDFADLARENKECGVAPVVPVVVGEVARKIIVDDVLQRYDQSVKESERRNREAEASHKFTMQILNLYKETQSLLSKT